MIDIYIYIRYLKNILIRMAIDDSSHFAIGIFGKEPLHAIAPGRTMGNIVAWLKCGMP